MGTGCTALGLQYLTPKQETPLEDATAWDVSAPPSQRSIIAKIARGLVSAPASLNRQPEVGAVATDPYFNRLFEAIL